MSANSSSANAPLPIISELANEIWQIDTAYHGGDVAVCYLIKGDTDYALVECGTGLSVEPIVAALDHLGVARGAVKLIIPTHVHLDHAGGAGGLMKALPQAQLWVHPRGLRHLVDPSKLLAGALAVYGEERFFALNGEILPCPAERSFSAEDGCKLSLNDRTLLLLDAPGHAKHHLMVWDARSQGFFTGDVFGLCYPQLAIEETPFIVPTTTPVQFDPEAWQQTLQRMADFAPQRMFLTHYGEISDVPERAEDLRKRLLRHAQIAQSDAANDHTTLWNALEDDLFADYQSSGGLLERERFANVLAMDLDLNAQGLQVWNQQRS